MSVTVTRTTNRPETSGDEGAETQPGRVQRRAAATGTRDEPPGKRQRVAVGIRRARRIQRHAGARRPPTDRRPPPPPARRFAVRSSTVSGALSSRPSLTTSCATYSPGRSAVNVGVAAAGSDSAAALPAGTATSDQRYDQRLPVGVRRRGRRRAPPCRLPARPADPLRRSRRARRWSWRSRPCPDRSTGPPSLTIELRHVHAVAIGDEPGRRRRGILQHGAAARGPGRERPFERDRRAIGIARRAAVERHTRARPPRIDPPRRAPPAPCCAS